MKVQSIVNVIILSAASMLLGCEGPTKAGKEARIQANARVNLMGAQIHYDQAQQTFRSGQFDRAMREINHAIARYPERGEYYLLKGRIELETHQLEAALKSLNMALEKNDQLADAHYYAGIVFQRWSDDEEAYNRYSNAAELDPSNVQYLLAAAESLIALGKFADARELIEPRVAYFEHNAALRQLQAQIALFEGDPEQAAMLYSQARLLNPDDDLLLEELIWAQYAAGMYGRCHDNIKFLQGKLPQQRPDLMHLEARCLAMMSRGIEARDVYMQLTRLRPADPVIWVELGTLAWELGDYRRVAMCSVQMIALAPHRYEGYMLKGVNERHRGRLDEAVTLFREATSRAPDVALPHLLLGQTLEQIGKPKEALLAYQNAIAAEPGSPEALELLRRLTDGQHVTVVPTQ